MSMIFPVAPNNANTFLAPSPVTPMALEITNITNTNPMIVTVAVGTDEVNDYVVGQKISFTIPNPYGIIEVDGLTGTIVLVATNNLSVDIDATQFSAFITPANFLRQPASIAPAGSKNIYNVTKVPFQAVNGQIGN